MKILIFGVTGMLGHQIYRILEKSFPGQVYGTIRKTHSDVSAFAFLKKEFLVESIDINDFKSVEKVLGNLKPEWIINCTGITLRKADSNDIEQCYRVNALFPQRLGQWAQVHQSRLIHFSTDCVFSGSKGNYTENSITDASDHYGQSKFLGEASGPHSLTLRLSIIGREILGKTELIEWFLSQKGKAVQGYSEVYYTGLTTQFVAKEVLRIIEKFPTLSGLYQVAGEKISKYELLKMLNQKFANNSDLKPEAMKKSDKSLNCDLYIQKTGFKKPTWNELLTELQKDNSFYEARA